jgi:hypothetical protein
MILDVIESNSIIVIFLIQLMQWLSLTHSLTYEIYNLGSSLNQLEVDIFFRSPRCLREKDRHGMK